MPKVRSQQVADLGFALSPGVYCRRLGSHASSSPLPYLHSEPHPHPHLLLSHTCVRSPTLRASHRGLVQLAVRHLQGGTVQQEILLL